ncbi:MAG: PTS fructose transporter subunit IIA [Thermodesulfobacteriota bacterium]|nr:PTS fructose transporter subunit IIA [Thermodesulfobacteriota bacterium]
MNGFGVIVATHGHLCEEMVRVAIHIMGDKLPVLTAFSVPFSLDDKSALKAALSDQIARLDCGGGVLILTDILGGTPTNLARSLLDENRIGIVTGVNLPMLLKLPRIKDIPLEEAVEILAGLAQKTIQPISRSL